MRGDVHVKPTHKELSRVVGLKVINIMNSVYFDIRRLFDSF